MWHVKAIAVGGGVIGALALLAWSLSLSQEATFYVLTASGIAVALLVAWTIGVIILAEMDIL